jgi:hypothetical protein
MSFIENNILIAEFMGWGERTSPTFRSPRSDRESSSFYFPEQLKFHLEWNWLMPAVVLIETIGFDTTIKPTEMAVWMPAGSLLINGSGKGKIDGIYNSVVNFIEWYNENHSSLSSAEKMRKCAAIFK